MAYLSIFQSLITSVFPDYLSSAGTESPPTNLGILKNRFLPSFLHVSIGLMEQKQINIGNIQPLQGRIDLLICIFIIGRNDLRCKKISSRFKQRFSANKSLGKGFTVYIFYHKAKQRSEPPGRNRRYGLMRR